MKVEIIKAEYGVGTGQNQKDVTELLRKQASDLPLITLPNPDYAESFGGDPAPGIVKQLKIKYKLNDRPGEVSFEEFAPSCSRHRGNPEGQVRHDIRRG